MEVLTLILVLISLYLHTKRRPVFLTPTEFRIAKKDYEIEEYLNRKYKQPETGSGELEKAYKERFENQQ